MPSLTIDVEAHFAKLHDALDQVNSKIGKSQQVFAQLGSSLAALGVTLSAGAIATGLLATVKNAINVQDEIGKMSQKIGVGTEALSALSFSAKLANVPIDTLQQSLKKLSVNMLETQAGTGEAKGAFEALGIAVESTKGNLKTTENLILELADKFAGMEDGAGKTALAVKLFGRAGAELIPLLNAGSQGLRENAEEAKRFGIIISTEASKASEQFNDNLTRLSEASRGFGIALANEVLPTLNKFVQGLLAFREAGGNSGFKGFLLALTTDTRDPINEINKLRGTLEKLRQTREELEKSKTSSLAGRLLPSMVDRDIKTIDQQIAVAQARMKGLTTLASATGDKDNFDAALNKRLAKAPALPTANAKAAIDPAIAATEHFRDILREFDDDLRKAEGVDSYFLKFKKKIDDNDKAFQNMTESQKNQILDAASALDVQLDALRQNKELEEGLAQDEKARSEAANKETADWAALEEKVRNMADSTRALRAEHAKYDELVARGLPEEIANFAKLSQELRNVLEPQKNLFDELQTAWEKNIITTDQMVEAYGRLTAPMGKVKSAGEDIGLIFTSAFEKAATAGAKFKDILKGLAQDIAKLILRKNVTEPILEATKGFDWSKLFSGLVGGSSGFAIGTDFVPRTGLALVHEGEQIIPAGEVRDGSGVNISIHMALGLRPEVRDELNAQMPRMTQQIIRAVQDSRNRSGDQR